MAVMSWYYLALSLYMSDVIYSNLMTHATMKSDGDMMFPMAGYVMLRYNKCIHFGMSLLDYIYFTASSQNSLYFKKLQYLKADWLEWWTSTNDKLTQKCLLHILFIYTFYVFTYT